MALVAVAAAPVVIVDVVVVVVVEPGRKGDSTYSLAMRSPSGRGAVRLTSGAGWTGGAGVGVGDASSLEASGVAGSGDRLALRKEVVVTVVLAGEGGSGLGGASGREWSWTRANWDIGCGGSGVERLGARGASGAGAANQCQCASAVAVALLAMILCWLNCCCCCCCCCSFS